MNREIASKSRSFAAESFSGLPLPTQARAHRVFRRRMVAFAVVSEARGGGDLTGAMERAAVAARRAVAGAALAAVGG